MRLLYLVLLIPFTLFAQPTRRTAEGWQELTISDGLSQGMIFDLAQDKQGFIWVATKDGLNRYDGHNFTVFTHEPHNAYSLSDNTCSALLVDRRGWLWVGTLNQGLNLFDTRSQRFYQLSIRDRALPNTANYAVNGLYEDPEGNIWVNANYDKLIKVHLSGALKTGFPPHPKLDDQVQLEQFSINGGATNAINHVSFRPDGQALAVSLGGLTSFNWKHPEKWVKVDPFPTNQAGINATYGDVNNDSWFGAINNTIVCCRRGRLKTIRVQKKNDAVISLKAINSTTLAVATDEFLWLMSPDELVRQDSLTARNAFTVLPPNLYGIGRMLADQTGNIWVGTSGYGLRKFNPKVKQFHSSLPDQTLSYLYADRQGRIYARHEFAYEQLDPSGNRLVPFLDNDLPPADKRARYMMQDRQGTFWVSNVNFQTHEMHLFKFSTEWKLLKKYPLPASTSFCSYGNQTAEDKAGKLWIAALNGKLLRFDPLAETFQVFSYQSLVPQRGAETETYALCFDGAGTLWIGTSKGLVRGAHPQTTPAFSIYKNSIDNSQSLSNDFVLSLLDDPVQPARYLWVGTKGGGLDRLDKQTGLFSHITEKQGLPNKVVYGILSDEFNNLWLSTNRGLAQFNPKTGTFHNFTKGDGLQDDEFNTNSFVKTPSGRLLFGGVHGLTAFRAKDVVRVSGVAPQAHLIGLKVNNEPVMVGGPDGILTEGIEFTKRIELAHDQNLLTLEFGVMDYANSAKNRYRYRLEGIDQDWVEAGTNRFANYAQLPNGNYTLQMMGSANGDVWSKPIDLQIQVHPPFYRSWWAYLLYMLVLTAIGWQLYRFQTQRLLLQQQVVFEQKEASRLAELDTLKTQFFANISHEFRTPLTLILGPIEQAIQDYAHDARFPLIQHNANRLLSLINQLLDLSKLEAGQLRPEAERGDIAAFFRTLASSFIPLAESRQVRFLFTQDREEQQADFDRDKIDKIVTNLLANAFKFTPAGKEVYMNIRYRNANPSGTVQITVEDTGIGIAPEHVARIFERFYQVDAKANRPFEGTGIGLALVHQLVKVLGGTIQVASIEDVGTSFTVTLPLVTGKQPDENARLTQLSSATAGPIKKDGDYVDSRTDPAPAPSMGSEEGNSSGPIGTPTGNENILLIIDDNADIRAYVRSIFEVDYQIIEAGDGQDGLDKATASLPNVVICDLMMPQLDGFGFCKALKGGEATSHIPVVMLTAKATIEDRIEGLELGADDYLTKPFNRIELQVRVRNLIGQRQRLYRHFKTQAADSTSAVNPLQLTERTLLKAEQQFMDRLTTLVMQQIDNADFTVEKLAEGVNMSRVQLHRKLKALANTTATDFIRQIRLTKAAELLQTGEQSVSQVAYSVGFDNLSYFAKVFQEHYGVLPSYYNKRTTSVS